MSNKEALCLLILSCLCYHFVWYLSVRHLANGMFRAGLPISRTSQAFQTSGRLARVIQHTLAPLVQTRHNSVDAYPEKAFKRRVQLIEEAVAESYPRLASNKNTVSCAEFRGRYSHLADNEIVEDDTVVINGRS